MAKIEDKWWWPFPIASMLGSSSAVVLGQSVYGRAHRNPFIKFVYNQLSRCSNAIYWVRYRTLKKYKYHLVNTGLKPGYYDEDTRLLWACFALLNQYVTWHGGTEALGKFTEELREETEDWRRDMTRPQEAHNDEVVTLWRWWNVERPANWALEEKMLHEIYHDRKLSFKKIEGSELSELVVTPEDPTKRWSSKELWDLQAKLRKDDQDMLHRLIDARPGLWT